MLKQQVNEIDSVRLTFAKERTKLNQYLIVELLGK